jgi:phosphoglycolate phosphatase-like HAD superfamily hydrolase
MTNKTEHSTTDGFLPISPSPGPRISSDPSPLLPVSDLSSLRILLWDIDGTLMRTVEAGSYKDYFVPMLERVFQTSGCLPELHVSGMTDLQIVAEALRDEGFTMERINQRLDDLRKCYMEEMRRVAGNGKPFFQLLPGARDVLQAVTDHPRYRSGLLTGNIEQAAYLKMELVGLSQFFDLPGAFGDESHDRRDLPALAADRIRKHLGFDFAPEQFIVIGDTPNDIVCAKHFGAKSLAVGTGRMFSKEDVLACHPDGFVTDFSDVHHTLKMLSEM